MKKKIMPNAQILGMTPSETATTFFARIFTELFSALSMLAEH
jgi:hypothetical protein